MKEKQDLSKELKDLKKELSQTRVFHTEMTNMLKFVTKQVDEKKQELGGVDDELEAKIKRAEEIKLNPVIKKEIVVKEVIVDEKNVLAREVEVAIEENQLAKQSLAIENEKDRYNQMNDELAYLQEKLNKKLKETEEVGFELKLEASALQVKKQEYDKRQQEIEKAEANPPVKIERVTKEVYIDDKNVGEREKELKVLEEHQARLTEKLKLREEIVMEHEETVKSKRIEIEALDVSLQIREGKVKERELLMKNKHYLKK